MRTHSRMCAYCAQSFNLHRRRYWTEYCCHHHWFEAMEAHIEAIKAQAMGARSFLVVPIWIAGGDGILHLVDVRVYEPVAPVD